MEIDEIKRLMNEKGLKQIHIARHLGIAANKISKAFKGERRFTAKEIDLLRELLTPEPIAPRPRAIPIIGQVAAGNWREAIQHPSGWMPLPDPSVPTRSFALRVVGDSMDRYVEDGGNVIVDPDDKALFPGRFYVVLNGDGETTFKQFQADPARLTPCSNNEDHRDILIGDGEHFEVVGRVIWRASRM